MSVFVVCFVVMCIFAGALQLMMWIFRLKPEGNIWRWVLWVFILSLTFAGMPPLLYVAVLAGIFAGFYVSRRWKQWFKRMIPDLLTN